jgi:hypothetical protein
MRAGTIMLAEPGSERTRIQREAAASAPGRMTGSDPLLAIDNSHGQATRRLIRLFTDATADELAYGLGWYVQAHETAAALGTAHGYTTRQVAGVIAALSPRSDWPQNVKRAGEMLASGDTYGLSNGRDKAKRILAGEDPADVLSGPKTRAFFDNLADPLASSAVTIDAHAYDAAAGMVTNDRQRKVLDRKGEYERIADIYRSAAGHLGVAPHVVQAVVWVVWRNRMGGFHYQRVNGDQR